MTLLAPQLTHDNYRAVLEAARHKSKREVEMQVAALRPLPSVPPSIRKVPERKSTAPMAPAAPDITRELEAEAPVCALGLAGKPAVVKAVAPEQYKIQFTISRETHDKLRRVRDLLRHSIPDGDPAKIFDKALTLLLADVEKKKLAAALKPRAQKQVAARATRHIPASVRRDVWKRDGGRCAFVGRKGRCEERGFLEFHHRLPFAAGGPSTVENLELRCRAHNAYEAELFFGPPIAREEPDLVDWAPGRARSGPS